MTFPEYPDSLLVRTVLRQKTDLLNAERANMAELTGRWLAHEQRLAPLMDSLAQELAAAETGPNLGALLKSQRYRELLTGVRTELSTFVDFAESNIIQAQEFYGALGLSDSVEALGARFAEFGRLANFPTLEAGALDDLVGVAGNGQSILSLLDPTINDAIQGMNRALLEGVAKGQDAGALVANMQDGLAWGYNRTLVTARSEPFRTYRTMVRQNWQASGLVGRYKRIAQHDSRVCAGCLMADGLVYKIDTDFEEHPSGRCFLVPIIAGLPTPEWESGQAWFARQPETVQADILGPGRLAAWKDGRYSLGDLVTHKHDREWGGSIHPTPLKDLIPPES